MIINFLIIIQDKNDVAEYIFITVFATTGSYIINFFNARKFISIHSFNYFSIKKHIKPILILFSFTISVNIYTVLDTFMLGVISGETAVGLYTASEKVCKLVNTIITSFGTVLMPRLSYYLETGYEKRFYGLAEKAYKFNFLFSVPAFIGLFMLRDEIILLFSGADFYRAKDTMRLLTPIVLVIPFSILTNNQILTPMRKEKLILISSCIGAGVNLLCNSLLIPKFAENGAAMGTVVAETAVMFVCFHNARKLLDMRNIFKGIWKYWLAAVPIIFIGIVVKNVFSNIILIVLITAMLGAGIYFGILCLLKESLTLEIIHRGVVVLKEKRRGFGL